MKLIVAVILTAIASTSILAQESTAQPEPRNSANLIYHNKLGKVLLLDGFIKEPLTEQIKIWSWEGNNWKLISDKGPMARTFGGVAYDSKRDKVVLYGGRTWPTEKMVIKEDTWEWDGKNWKQYTDTSLGAINRHHLTMIYDKSNAKTILMGGVGLNQDKSEYTWPADMWSWDGRNWSQIINSNGPSGRPCTASLKIIKFLPTGQN